ncbi:MAG: hypothetical protein CVV44_16125 [Spirochaetae bacterium HGW-Spirochaetae-1]|jgi:hypothetical protein|nr:MAG: hypothetical protein CVV44_16125 [Spirochaetae bacterium HGW-Spirochaetae-1]
MKKILFSLCLILIGIIPGKLMAQSALEGMFSTDPVTMESINQDLANAGITGATVYFNQAVTVPAIDNPHSNGDIKLWATVITPASAAAKKLPTILIATPYRRDGMIKGLFPFLKMDYAVMVIDIRGTGSSGGYWCSFDLCEQYDIKYVVDRWIPAQKWSNGQVGMYGASYMGIIQMLTAGLVDVDEETGEPVHLKAIFPAVPMSDAYRDIVMHGGNVDMAFIPQWMGTVDIMALMPSLLYRQDDDGVTAYDIAEAVFNWTASMEQLGITAGWIMDAGHIEDGPFYDRKSPMIYWPVKPQAGWGFTEGDTRTISTSLPVLTIGGWFDIFTRGTLNNFQYGLADHAAADKAMIVGEWYHATAAMGPGVTSLSNGELAVRWFDWKIKNKSDSFMAEYPVLLYVMGVDRWRAEKSWPLPGDRVTGKTMFLSRAVIDPIEGDPFTNREGNLIYGLCGDSGAVDYDGEDPVLNHSEYQYLHGWSSRSDCRWMAGLFAIEQQTSKLEQGINNDADYWFEDERSDDWKIPTFTTEPLEEDMEITGPVLLKFWARTEFPNTLFPLKIDALTKLIKFKTGMSENLILDMLNDKDVQFVAELNDVFPDGRARNITSGWLRASHRQKNSQESPAETEHALDPAYVPFDPFYDSPDKTPEKISEGELYEYAIELWPTCNVFRKGHRIRVTLSASDFPHLLPILQPSKTTLVMDEDHRAVVEFSVTGSEGEGESWKWVDDVDKYLTKEKDDPRFGGYDGRSAVDDTAGSRNAGGCGSAAHAGTGHGVETAMPGLLNLMATMLIPLILVLRRRWIKYPSR